MEEKKEYLENTIKPIMENLIFSLVSERPEKPYPFMINWLEKTGGYTSEGLTFFEKKELEDLRLDILKYRALEEEYHSEEEEGIVDNKKETENEVSVANPVSKKKEDKNASKKMDKSEEESGTDSDEEEVMVVDLEARKVQNKGKGPRVGVSAETYGKFNKKEDFEPRYIMKNENQINRIKSRILQSFIFSNLEQKDVNSVIGAMDEKSYNPGDYVIKQGEQGDCLFVIESGDLDCFKRFTKDADNVLVKIYTAGDSFGELSLLYNAPRAASVVAKTKTICWALDRETFNNIVKDAARKKREKYETFLRSVNILESIEDYELTQVCDAVRACTFKEGEYVIREGEVGDRFYIIEEGEAVATITKVTGKAPEPVLYYKKGAYFGELALLKGDPRAANIVAKTDLDLISLDRYSFKRLLGSLDDILKKRSEKMYGKNSKK